jgi:hypothetical protein
LTITCDAVITQVQPSNRLVSNATKHGTKSVEWVIGIHNIQFDAAIEIYRSHGAGTRFVDT